MSTWSRKSKKLYYQFFITKTIIFRVEKVGVKIWFLAEVKKIIKWMNYCIKNQSFKNEFKVKKVMFRVSSKKNYKMNYLIQNWSGLMRKWVENQRGHCQASSISRSKRSNSEDIVRTVSKKKPKWIIQFKIDQMLWGNGSRTIEVTVKRLRFQG